MSPNQASLGSTVLVRAAHLGLLLFALTLAPACTHVRGARRNPQSGETWTVYKHTFESDTVSYCAPPQWGGACFEARQVSRAPTVMPSQPYNAATPQWASPPPPMGPWVPQAPPNGWGR